MESNLEDHIESGRLVQVLRDWCPSFPGYFLRARHLPATPISLLERVPMLTEEHYFIERNAEGIPSKRQGGVSECSVRYSRDAACLAENSILSIGRMWPEFGMRNR